MFRNSVPPRLFCRLFGTIPSNNKGPKLMFDDVSRSFARHSTFDLFSSYVILSLCRVQPLVRHSETLISWSKAVLGKEFTEKVIKATFFSHFCAGENEKSLALAVKRLQGLGLSSILDYAAESDDSHPKPTSSVTPSSLSLASDTGITRAYSSSTLQSGDVGLESQSLSARGFSKLQASPDLLAEERAMDANAASLLSSIQAAKDVKAFVAMKVTALFPPSVLRVVTSGVYSVHDFALKHADYTSGSCSRVSIERMKTLAAPIFGEEPAMRLLQLFSKDGKDLDDLDLESLFSHCTLAPQDQLSLISRAIQTPEEARMVNFDEHYTSQLPSKICSLFGIQYDHVNFPLAYVRWTTGVDRVNKLAEAVRKGNVSMLVDAEQSYFQGAIDLVSVLLLRQCNALPQVTAEAPEISILAANQTADSHSNDPNPNITVASALDVQTRILMARATVMARALPTPHYPLSLIPTATISPLPPSTGVVFITVQAYLKSAPLTLEKYTRRCEYEGLQLATKLVRGAYMVQERELAAKRGLPSPVHSTISETHSCYDSLAFRLLESVKNRFDRVVLASHNETTVQRAVDAMAMLGLQQSELVAFAQLYGMADHVTFALASEGFKAFKYLPYGPVGEVIPYLIRRAQENSSMLGGTQKEIRLLSSEMKRRIWG